MSMNDFNRLPDAPIGVDARQEMENRRTNTKLDPVPVFDYVDWLEGELVVARSKPPGQAPADPLGDLVRDWYRKGVAVERAIENMEDGGVVSDLAQDHAQAKAALMQALAGER